MKIRKTVAEDLTEIRELLVDLGYPCDPALLRRRMAEMSADQTEDLLVAEGEAGRVLAVISIHYVPQLPLAGDFARISYFCVGAGARSRGLGRTIEAEVVRRATARKCDRIELHCHSRRVDAHRFYQARGYIEAPKYFVKHLTTTRAGA
ncbi:GNAT family N-acetyltransferase [Opitutaceae bacterium EW11]|nr:GNAT family N-acetyltransferase [Opitutaceae bacterium EW11]